jgi:hypothetical protein
MALQTNDIRFIARCFKCSHHLGDWALKLKKEDRLCWDCRPPKQLDAIGYKVTSKSEEVEGKTPLSVKPTQSSQGA